jgi:CSLREA domain-containing protein
VNQLQTLFGKGFNVGARGFLAASLALTALGLAAAPAAAATVVVNTTTDQALGDCSSSCSLRDAVATAAPGDTVQIPAGHYVLTLGFMLIQKDLTFTGAGARTTVIDGNANSSIFIFLGIIHAELDDLSLVNGKSNSGGALSAVSFTPPALLALTIRRCTFTNNQTSFQGGAIDLQLVDLTVEDSTFSNNHAATQSSGGAINSNQARGSIVNSTFSGNTAGVAGALSFGRGPVATALSLINNTFTANQGTRTIGGILTSVDQLTLSNNIIAGNVGGDCSLSSASIITDHNLDGDSTCHLTGPGDLPGTNPLLEPLADNGGPTDTHALLAGSPALDAGSNTGCPAADQRGVTRPQRGICDIGAVEMVNTPPTLASNQASVTVNEGQTAVNTGTVTDAEHDTVTLSASVGTVVNNGNGTWSWSFATSDGPTQSQTVTITGNDGQGGTSTTTFALVVNNVAPTITSVSNNGPIIVGGSATITVTATDPAGANDPLTYSFDCDNNGTFEIGPQAGNSASCTFATTGSRTVNVRVADGDGGVATGSTVVTVVFPPPSCASATASPGQLWPPNHKFVAIAIGGIVNPAPGAVTVTVTSIRQDEPTGGDVDGTGVGTGAPSVRSERDGGGDGRVYHINFTATGASGSCTGSVTVGVPHDQGHGSLVDQGPLYNSTLP